MAFIPRNRRSVFILTLCFVSFLVFSLYIKDNKPNVNNILADFEDASIVLNDDPKKSLWRPGTNQPEFSSDFNVVTYESKRVSTSNEDYVMSGEDEQQLSKKNKLRLQHLLKSKSTLSDLIHNLHVTFPEDGISGPTDSKEDSLVTTRIEKFTKSDAVTEPLPANTIINPEKDLGQNSVKITSIAPKVQTEYEITTSGKTTNSKITPTKNPALIVDTPGCKIPKMDPFDPSVKNLIEIKDSITCSNIPQLLTPLPYGIVHLNGNVLTKYYNVTPDDIQCWYQAIIRKHEAPGNNRENDYTTSEVLELVFDKPLEHEYLAVKCIFRDNRTVEQFIPLVMLKKEVEQERSKIKPPSPLNVILLGIDSVSKLNFLRHFRQTKAFLKDKLKPFDMKGYTKVGDNTFPNLVPMLSGHFVEDFWNETIRDTFTFDNISLIWKNYAKKGFRTLYAEDSPYTGTFNYIKRGFHDPPTDYYYRPLALAIENSDFRRNNSGSPCIHNDLETDLMYDYLKNFVQTMDTRPYFAFVMVSILTHDYLNSASYADAPAARILRVLRDLGAFNNSAIVIFSDHGLRFGAIRHTYIGKFEERMPFMYIHFPQWFLDQHPEFKRNLAINQERLITLFDLHATMKHLLHLDGTSLEETGELGLSLLNEIPDNRTCKDASILEHWCPCNSFNSVPVTDPTVVNVSNALVDHINNLLLPHQNVCSTLEVDQITDARLGLPNKVVLKFERHDNVVVNRTVVLGDEPPTLGDYLITLTLKPGGAIFEGTVRYDEAKRDPKILGISRINMYGKTSWCINSQKLKLYCYCKTQQQ